MTTPKPIKTTTINSFWNEWSAAKPTNLGENEVDIHSTHAKNPDRSNGMIQQTTPTAFVRTTTPDMAPWMMEILNEHSSTTTPRSPVKNKDQNSNENHTTDRPTNGVAELPSWMSDVLNEHSTTTTRKNIQFENNNTKQKPIGGSGGGGGNNNKGDSHLPMQIRYLM